VTPNGEDLVNPGDDLAEESLAAILGDRRVQSQPMLLSTAITAAEWVRSGAPDGAVVVADYQISARGRAGRPWKMTPGHGLGFALVLRPELESDREGWLYAVILAALADTCGDGVTIEWPDEVQRDGVTVALVGMDVRLGGLTIESAIANVLIVDAEPPRGELLGSVLQAINARIANPRRTLIDDYASLCSTIGRTVRMRLLGGTTRLAGKAVELADDGSLVVELREGRRVPVRPQDIASIEPVQ